MGGAGWGAGAITVGRAAGARRFAAGRFLVAFLVVRFLALERAFLAGRRAGHGASWPCASSALRFAGFFAAALLRGPLRGRPLLGCLLGGPLLGAGAGLLGGPTGGGAALRGLALRGLLRGALRGPLRGRSLGTRAPRRRLAGRGLPLRGFPGRAFGRHLHSLAGHMAEFGRILPRRVLRRGDQYAAGVARVEDDTPTAEPLHAGPVTRWRVALTTGNAPPGPTDPVTRWLVLARASVLPMTVTAGLLALLLAWWNDADHLNVGLGVLAAAGHRAGARGQQPHERPLRPRGRHRLVAYPRALYAPHPVLSGMIDPPWPPRPRRSS